MNTKREQLVEVLKKLDNETIKIVTVTSQVALKKSRTTGLETPEDLREIKKYALRENLFVGEYSKFIKKMRFKEASVIEKIKKLFTGDDFKAQVT